VFSQSFIMEIQTQEARIILVIKAIWIFKKLSCRSVAKIYKVPETTLRYRMIGLTVYNETRPNYQKLSKLEERILIWYILDLDSRGFISWFAGVEDIANYILESRKGDCINKLWVY